MEADIGNPIEFNKNDFEKVIDKGSIKIIQKNDNKK